MPKIQKRPVEVEVRPADPGETIETREGVLTADEGDLIITGVNGEEYPIGPEIMAKTYVPADLDSMELFREATPDGVVIEYEDGEDVTRITGVYVDMREPLDGDELRRAEAFADDLMATSPHLQGQQLAYYE